MVGLKNTTVRLGNSDEFKPSELVTVTIGWSEEESQPLYVARILSVNYKKIKDLSKDDLEGESPECSYKDSVKYAPCQPFTVES